MAEPERSTEEGIALSELQLALMRLLWRDGEASVADMATEMARSRGLAHTTVATVLTRLAKRGIVEARRDGRQLIYRPCVDEAQVRRSMVGDLVQTLFRGDAQALLAHLVDESAVGPGDLERVRALLARPERKP